MKLRKIENFETKYSPDMGYYAYSEGKFEIWYHDEKYGAYSTGNLGREQLRCTDAKKCNTKGTKYSNSDTIYFAESFKKAIG